MHCTSAHCTTLPSTTLQLPSIANQQRQEALGELRPLALCELLAEPTPLLGAHLPIAIRIQGLKDAEVPLMALHPLCPGHSAVLIEINRSEGHHHTAVSLHLLMLPVMCLPIMLRLQSIGGPMSRGLTRACSRRPLGLCCPFRFAQRCIC